MTTRVPASTWIGRAAPVGVAALLLATACTGDPTTSAAPGSSSHDEIDVVEGSAPPPELTVVDVPDGQIDAAVDALPGLVEAAQAETGVPGIGVAVVHDGEVVFAEGFGVTNVDTGQEVDADTAFQVASLSKSIGATVISTEVSDGTIAWDDEIAPNLPGFELADPYVTEHVTYADLYSHRSGLPPHIGDTLEDLGYDRATILERLRYAPLLPFRAQNRYTNFGLTAAGEAAANAAGTTWEQLSKDLLYDPLGMTATTSSYEEFRARANKADLHVKTDDGWEQLYERDPDAQSPAGGVSSSPHDMARWMNFVLAGGEVGGDVRIDPKVMSEMLWFHSQGSQPGSLASRPGMDALGFNTGVNSTARVTFSHSGAFALGTGTAFTMVPSENLGIVVLTNGSPIGVAEAINAQFMDLALVGAMTQDWLPAFQGLFAQTLENPASLTEPAPADPAPALEDEAYVGTYPNEYYGTVEVAAGPDGLVLSIGPERSAYPLTHWDGNEFTWVAPGENSPGPSLVVFSPDGEAMAMEIVALNGVEPLGVFTRS